MAFVEAFFVAQGIQFGFLSTGNGMSILGFVISLSWELCLVKIFKCICGY